MSPVGEGTLKLVCLQADQPGRDAIRSLLDAKLGAHSVRELDGESYLVHTSIEPSEIRDWLMRSGHAARWVMVVEFEKWSGWGDAIDREWLLARGH